MGVSHRQGHISNPTGASDNRATCVFISRLCRAVSRSTPLCSSWPAPRAASTCGSVRWRATPSSACASPPRGRPVATNSPGSAPASGSGEPEGDWRWLAQIPAIGERSVSHHPRPLYLWLLCIYGYIDQPPPPHPPSTTTNTTTFLQQPSLIVSCVTIIRGGQSNLSLSKDAALFVGAAE